MCPDRKLQWFRDQQRSSTQITRIRERVVTRFNANFKKIVAGPAPLPVPASVPTLSGPARFLRRQAPSAPIVQIPNDINSYLDTPPIPLPVGMTYITFWHHERHHQPELAEMALTYCSSAATSVDGERSFSEGRNQCHWNQHNMTSQTFREKMCLGAWHDSPFFDLDRAEKIISENSSSLRGPR